MLPKLVRLLLTPLIISASLFGHIISIDKINSSTLFGIWYTNRGGVSIFISSIQLSLHIPRANCPYWAVLTVRDYVYNDASCQVNLRSLHATFWLLPVTFGFTAGPWVTARMERFRVRLAESQTTPTWVKILRENLLTTILEGETVSFQNLKTKLFFGIPTGTEGKSSDQVEKPGLAEDEIYDEVRATASADHWHIVGLSDRMYTFGRLDVDLRRSWVDNMGIFNLKGERCNWTKVPSLARIANYRNSWRPWQLLKALAHFPRDIFHLARDPLDAIDLQVTHCDISFAKFRIRDSELLKRGGKMFQRRYEAGCRGLPQGFGWDIFVNAVFSVYSLIV